MAAYTSDAEDVTKLARELFSRITPKVRTIGVDVRQEKRGDDGTVLRRGHVGPCRVFVIATAFASDNASSSSQVPGVREAIRAEVLVDTSVPAGPLKHGGHHGGGVAIAQSKAMGKLGETLREILSTPGLPSTIPLPKKETP
jgi:hypothetical protein